MIEYLQNKININTYIMGKLALDAKAIDIQQDAIQDYITSHSLYYGTFRRFPDIVNPTKFTEKIQRRKIIERGSLYVQCADKYAVKDYVAKCVGEKYVIPLLFMTDKPAEIPFWSMPNEYVIKATHGCGYNIICMDEVIQVDDVKYLKKEFGKNKIIEQCINWINSIYGVQTGEWLYRKIKPRIIVEKLIRDSEGNIPKDYRLHCFHGKVHMIQVDQTLGHHDVVQAFYTREWKKINVYYKRMNPQEIEKPSVLSELVAVAEKLSANFSYVRVDLYLSANQVYFGELTFYPVAGFIPFVPADYDNLLGDLWK